MDDRPTGEPRVLLVEDDPATVELYHIGLGRKGYDVSHARTATEAIDHIRRKRVDAVLMDVMLPGIDGLEITRRIRSLDEPHCRVPVIGLSARAFSRDRQYAMDAGMDRYLTKPATLAQVAAAIASLLGR